MKQYILWHCPFCSEIWYSDRKERHKLDECGCGRSCCDAEEEYVRIIGDAQIIFEEV